ncbi:unnamed protein product [Ectocarpus sp. CCAP 1310/34]|nr:unnamed protein product [Ectocarpus sp. CCAP 1310/34]
MRDPCRTNAKSAEKLNASARAAIKPRTRSSSPGPITEECMVVTRVQVEASEPEGFNFTIVVGYDTQAHKEPAAVRWDKVVERVWKEIGDEGETLDTEGFGGFKKKVKEMLESREEATLRKKVRSEDHLETYGKLKEGIRMKSYLDGPMDDAKKLKLQFRVGDLDLPERRKRYSCRRREEEEDRQTCPCGKSEESRPHIVGECELYRKEREDLEEDMRH